MKKSNMKKSKKRVIKSYKRNKRYKSRKNKTKRLKMVGGAISIYDTQEDQNVELSKENYKLQTQLEEVNKKLRICEKENKRLKTQLEISNSDLSSLVQLYDNKLKMRGKNTPIPHAETTLEYHQSELDRMEREDDSESGVKITPAVDPSIKDYSVGQEVIYMEKAKIVRIYENVGPGEEPFVEIALPLGKIRQTNLDRIRPIY